MDLSLTDKFTRNQCLAVNPSGLPCTRPANHSEDHMYWDAESGELIEHWPQAEKQPATALFSWRGR
jgi:hypothetical protein